MAHNETSNITAIRLGDGTLPAFAFPGGYPLYYLDEEGNTLCPECARKNDEYTSPLAAYGVNYEDPKLHCDDCSRRIESAYAEE